MRQVFKLTEASDKSAALGALPADSSVDKKKARAKKLLRDQAHTHLKEAVDEIRECGQYVFRKNPEREEGYASDYLKKARKVLKKDKQAEKTEPSVS